MKAVVYHEPKNVTVEDVDDATIEDPTDVLVHVTTTAICGRICTCMRDGPTSRRGPCSGTRTWAR